jgi:hypothetical protein
MHKAEHIWAVDLSAVLLAVGLITGAGITGPA